MNPISQWLVNHPIIAALIYGIGTGVVTALTPYAAQSELIGVIVMIVQLIDSQITSQNRPLDFITGQRTETIRATN